MKIHLLLIAAIATHTAHAAVDRTPPTRPGNYRVTATTPFTATVAWTPSTDNSGNFTYVLASTGQPGERVTLPKTSTSFTFTKDLHPLNTYSFIIQAIDAAGNYSSPISVSARLPADTRPPTVAPVLSATDIASTYVSLAWTPAQDDGPYLTYELFINGSLFWNLGTNRTTSVRQLVANTTYTFNVRARDSGNNPSPLSNPVTVTTRPDTTDTTPPTTPGNLSQMNWCDEVHLTWTQSTDNFDPQPNIRYDVYVNGELFEWQFGSGGPAIVYGNPGELNVFEVIAVDSHGNESVPARLEVVLCQ